MSKKLITFHELRNFLPLLSMEKAELFLPHLDAAMREQHITLRTERAAFLANLAHESNELTKWLENMNYSAKRLLQVFPKYFNTNTAQNYAHKPQAIANRVYGNRYGNGDEASGDGWRYRAHGPIGLTFRANFRRYGDLLGLPLERNPELAALPENGFRIAALFWKLGGCNELAAQLSGNENLTRSDKKLLTRICERINGGHNGLADRIEYYKRALEVLHPDGEEQKGATPATASSDTVKTGEVSSLPAQQPDNANLLTAAMGSEKAKAAGLKLWPRIMKHGSASLGFLYALMEAHKIATVLMLLVIVAALAWLAYHNREPIKAKLLEVLK